MRRVATPASVPARRRSIRVPQRIDGMHAILLLGKATIAKEQKTAGELANLIQNELGQSHVSVSV
jgi:hypothetical protein